MVEEMGSWSEDKIKDLLSKEGKIKIKINATFGQLEMPFTALALVDSNEYTQMQNEILRKFKEQKVIYITISNSYKKILAQLKKEKISNKKIHFIDMISVDRGIETKAEENVSLIESPAGLTELVEQVDKSLKNTGKNTIVILDSISTMTVYNDTSTAEKVIHTIIGKINTNNASAILMSSDSKGTEKITKIIGQFVDKTIVI